MRAGPLQGCPSSAVVLLGRGLIWPASLLAVRCGAEATSAHVLCACRKRAIELSEKGGLVEKTGGCFGGERVRTLPLHAACIHNATAPAPTLAWPAACFCSRARLRAAETARLAKPRTTRTP